MKTSLPLQRTSHSAFTLIELLVVIAIIGILAALILTPVIKNTSQGKIKKAKLQIVEIIQAINSYHAEHSAYPVSHTVMTTATTAKDDFTYGGTGLTTTLGPGTWTANNSDVIAILMDLETDGVGNPTVNQGHVKNPQKTKYLNAQMVTGTSDPGVGSDIVYRDPWGQPYIISLDLNYDDKCKDAFYSQRSVSQQSGATGFNGLINSSDAGGGGNNFLYHGGVMVWSLGPDKTASATVNADTDPNKDNLLSWK